MRVKLPLGRSLYFGCAFLFSMVALVPLRSGIEWLGLDAKGLAAREAQGSIWMGYLSEAQLGPLALGDLGTSLRTLPLFLGRARIDLDRDEEADPFSGSLTASRHRLGLDDLEARLATGAVFAPLPIASVQMDDVTAHFANGACTAAEGRVSATMAGDVAGMALPGGLSGSARCDGGALLLPLTGQTGMETLDIRLFGNGRYRIDLGIRPGDPSLAARLTAAGFTSAANGGYATRVEGSF